MNEIVSCPGCQSRMRALALDEAEIDYCTFCGGAWFDPGEVEAVVGHPLTTIPSGHETKRRCARCQVPMAGASLGVVAVEQCPECGGIYLDQGEIDAVARRSLDLGARAAETAQTVETARTLTAACEGCQRTFRLAELVSTAQGLTCSACYLTLSDGVEVISSPADRDPSTTPTHRDGGLVDLVLVADGILDILGLFGIIR